MDYSRKIIDNGIGFNTLGDELSKKFKFESVAVMFNSPLDERRASYAALLLNVLMRGNNKFPTVQLLSRRLDELYDASLSSSCFKRGENHVCVFALTCFKNEYGFSDINIIESALDVLYEVLTDPVTVNGVFSSFFVEREKANLIDGINARKNDKVSYAPSRCVKIMCESEPYSIEPFGSIEIISEITAEALYDFYKNEFVKFGCEVFYLGEDPVPAHTFAKKLKTAFANDEKYSIIASTEHITKDVKRVCEIENVSQAKLSMGLNTGKRLSEEDYYKYTVFAEIFSNSPSSRLFKNVREKLSLCYYCKCVTDHHKGIAVVSLGIDADKAVDAENEIMHQIKLMADGHISEEELELAKLTINAAYREVYDTQAGLINWYYNRLCAGDGQRLISPIENAKRIMGVNTKDVSECAALIKLDTVYVMKGGDICE